MRISLIFLTMILCGCIQIKAEFVPPSGLIYTSVKAPLTIKFSDTPVSDNTATEKKEYIQIPVRVGAGMPSFGFDDDKYGDKPFDGSRLAEAFYSDYEYMAILGVYARTKIMYYGK